MRMMTSDIRFTALGAPRRVWTISAIHGELEKLYALHDALLERLTPGDRIVYLGNYTGHGLRSRETVDEIITFRRLALSMPGMQASDLIYLRGRQEDMWQKLLELQFTAQPADSLSELLSNGMEQTLQSYGIQSTEGLRACREGVLSITRWVNKIRTVLRQNAGHDILMTQYRRAAYTCDQTRYPVLFVHSGIDVTRPIDEQGDHLFWKGEDFCDISQPYSPFEKVIRGYDPRHQGLRLNCVTASLDGGAGFGGPLIGACVDFNGHVRELLEA